MHSYSVIYKESLNALCVKEIKLIKCTICNTTFPAKAIITRHVTLCYTLGPKLEKLIPRVN